MDLQLTGKVALVAAASRGLGKAAAMKLAEEGCRLAIFSRGEEQIQQAADEIRSATGAEVFARPVDLRDGQALANFVAAAADHYGQINIVVGNAGGPPAGQLLDLTDEQWQQAFELLLLSAARLCRLTIPHLKAAGGGSVVYITSAAVKQPYSNLILSNSIRLGVLGLLKTLALEYAAEGIRFNSVMPGPILTDRQWELARAKAGVTGQTPEEILAETARGIPMGRIGEPEELANLVAFLASPRAAYITGAFVQVDGGQYKGLL
ncbi:MAG TPA: SDR family oxidoreductase [Sphingobacteriaceae bacterium]|nr:SDR family oxidoreductase [Sphingobacteriaceae bacterium]